MAPWLDKVHSKKHNLPDIMLEDSRIQVIETRVTQSILSDAEEYNRDLNEKEKEAILEAMVKQEEERQAAVDEPDSSLGRITSRMDSKGLMNATPTGDIKQGTIGASDTFNILPVPSGTQSPRSPHHPRKSTKSPLGRQTHMKGTIESEVSNLQNRPSILDSGTFS